ncbi:hypothetical protein theurythT_28520 [Thalassotalea eurytherma]|uniref:Transposase family protein n=1 Tax=Thalassotalea eurytherma TaxID=1144278 RepID=A0ABQ6H628_9GAMM|nr:hypothetical protein theurythT_28520 [Thalassotalea eurytherma]
MIFGLKKSKKRQTDNRYLYVYAVIISFCVLFNSEKTQYLH